jgi:nitroimidazol reductase NimA-like FMN-containing flavoprotein (pyridoxamine 5'-phosphate oxidase superfamily)
MRQLRRSDRGLSRQETAQLLEQGEYGMLSTVDDRGQPYGVPLSYVYRHGSIYFHCALSGHKLDNLALNPRVCFSVVGRTELLPAEFATRYQSALAFGRAEEVFAEERLSALRWLVEKYSPDFQAEGEDYIAQQQHATRVIKITIDQLSGKARR